MRLDKWLWAARFYKTRGLAVEDIDKGRVQVNGQAAKRSRELRVGDRVSLRQGERGEIAREVRVLGLSEVRGPAPVAQLLYAETPRASPRARRPAQAGAYAPSRPTHRTGPADQARSAQTGRLAALERVSD